MRLLAVALLAAVMNLLCSWHVLALQERHVVAALAIDAVYPFLGLLSLVWIVEAETWRERWEITGATAAGLVAGTAAVFVWW